MKFHVDSRELARAISPAVEVATKGSEREFAYEELVTLKADKDKISVFAYGGISSLTSSVSANNFSSLNYTCQEEGSTTVYAVDLYKSLTTMEPGEVEIKLSSNSLTVSLLSNEDNKRSMATETQIVKPPNMGLQFEQTIEVNRETFIKGLHSVMFAPAVEEKMFTYMCVLMEALTNNGKQILRFSAGTGGRFAVKEIEGKHIFTATEEVKIILPKNNLSSIHRVISLANCENISIRTVVQDAQKDIPEQIMIEFNGFVMCIFGLENFTKYPDLTSIINHQYSNRIYSDLKEWEYAVGGVEMSERGHASDIHNTQVVLDMEHERFIITPQTIHACTTPINIVDAQNCITKGDKIWFKCNSIYLKEMMARGGVNGKIQLNFDSQELLNDIPKDKPKQMRPVLVKFPEKSNEAKDEKENFYMFFTVSTK
jgi:hypothetical protein